MESFISMDQLNFDTDLSHYTLDDLFSLLDIKITDTSDVVSIKQLIIERTDQYIEQFTEAKRENMAVFFREMKNTLLGKPIDVSLNSSQTVLRYKNDYIPFTSSLKENANTDLYSPGESGNPFHRKTITQLLNVDSRFRHNYHTTSSTNYLIDLPHTLQHVIEMKISDVELSTNYYPISDSLLNNYFWIATYTQEQLETNEPTLYYIYIPSGNYYYLNLVEFINAALQDIEPPIVTDGYEYNPPISIKIDVSYENTAGFANGTGKSSIGILSPDSILNNTAWKLVKMDLKFNSPPIPGATTSVKVVNPEERELYNTIGANSYKTQFGWMLGFRKSTYGTQNTLVYKSESIVNLLGPQYVYLVVNDFNKNRNNHFIGTSSEGLLPTDILARISIKSPVFNIQTQNDFSVYAETRQYFGPVKINKIRVQLVDEYGRFVDMNYSDFSFTIRITSVYSPN